MKSVMFVISSLGRGGAERVLSQLTAFFTSCGSRVKVILVSNHAVRYALPSAVQVEWIPKEDKASIYERIRFIRSHAKAFRPDAVISFLADINLYTVTALAFTGIPVYVSERNDPAHWTCSRIVRKLIRIAYVMASGVVFQTESAKSQFSKIIQKKCTIIPNPVMNGLPIASPAYHEMRIVAVGRLEKQKNYQLLLQAFSLLLDECHNATLEIFGDGSQQMVLKEQTRALGIKDSVIFQGVRDDVHERIKNANLFVMSSDFEGMPNALMEAMTMGLPCVCTDCPSGGPSELIQNENNGLLVPVGDEQELARAMYQMLQDPEKSVEMGKRARMSMERYSLDAIGAQWLDLIGEYR